VLLALPLGYIALVNAKPFWAVFAILWTQSGLMLLLRMLGIRFKVRMWLLVPIAVLSVLVGAVTSAWPAGQLAGLRSAPWALLSLAALAIGLSTVLSTYSFPLGFGERAK
jgi:hypothetical protein